MSVIIDEKDLTKYIERHSPALGGMLNYFGLGVEDEGKTIERLLNELPKDVPIRIEDTKYLFRRGIYKITEINSRWEETLFRFTISLKKLL